MAAELDVALEVLTHSPTQAWKRVRVKVRHGQGYGDADRQGAKPSQQPIAWRRAAQRHRRRGMEKQADQERDGPDDRHIETVLEEAVVADTNDPNQVDERCATHDRGRAPRLPFGEAQHETDERRSHQDGDRGFGHETDEALPALGPHTQAASGFRVVRIGKRETVVGKPKRKVQRDCKAWQSVREQSSRQRSSTVQMQSEAEAPEHQSLGPR
ncbi:MAG: hypothetical protein JRF70_14320 [Deltaproteobacteria bacterium]|nr:hypothetical protein [Deltaproteobacteria bacterium]